MAVTTVHERENPFGRMIAIPIMLDPGPQRIEIEMPDWPEDMRNAVQTLVRGFLDETLGRNMSVEERGAYILANFGAIRTRTYSYREEE